jgi:CBS domain-containing protein
LVASSDGSRVEGILSERDVLVGIDTQGPEFLNRPVNECVTADVITATVGDLISDVMATMSTRRIRHLPVTNTGRLVGIISVGDLLLFRLNQLAPRQADSSGG